jgi:CrcB protein
LSTEKSAQQRRDCHPGARVVLLLRVTRLLLVGLGGMVGSIARFWLSASVQGASGGSPFPFGTLTVNIIGSFILGIVMTLQLEREIISPEIRVLLGAGFCGGFTTMSTFSYETMYLLQYGNTGTALANVGASLVTCLAAVWAGVLVGRLF